jgi:lysophospholipase L1-like esterase
MQHFLQDVFGIAPVVLALSVLAGATRAMAAEKDLSKGCKILLLGDSLIASSGGETSVQYKMEKILAKLAPDAKFQITNLARGGMWIGPASPGPEITGISEPLLKEGGNDHYSNVRRQCPSADAVFIMFSANDSKVYPPEEFGKKLAALCDRIAKDYLNPRIFLVTTMYMDPNHSSDKYYRTPSMVKDFKQGASRNKYLHPFCEEIRKLAQQRKYVLVDVNERVKAESEAGNWDLRVRSDPASDKTDDIHANPNGTEVIADAFVRALLARNDVLTPFSKQGSGPNKK